MAGYRLHLHHADWENHDRLQCLGELPDRVAVEQLAHELHPVEPGGYAVMFAAVGPDGHVAAAGHFYVRAAAAVAPTTRSRNRPS